MMPGNGEREERHGMRKEADPETNPEMLVDGGEDDGLEENPYDKKYENENSWEQLEEDEFGNLRAVVSDEQQKVRRRRILTAAESARIRRGMIRYVELIVDLSRASSITDMRPVRSAVIFTSIAQFLRTFFDENPLSQIGIVVLRNGIAERVTELSSSPESHIEKLKQNLDSGGDASLENGLTMATESLRHIPPYGHREILVVLSSLSLCDPGDIMKSIKTCKDSKIRISIIGLSAEIFVCRLACERTGGTYGVATGEAHLDELMLSHAIPPPAASQSIGASLVRMGFPAKGPEAPGAVAFAGNECHLVAGAYACPRCKGIVEELPSQCHICGLTLVSSPHLARSYHHLFPVKLFEEIELYLDKSAGGQQGDVSMGMGNQIRISSNSGVSEHRCYACFWDFFDSLNHQVTRFPQRIKLGKIQSKHSQKVQAFRCPDCKYLFCRDCEDYIHEYLHSCPGCEVIPPKNRI